MRLAQTNIAFMRLHRGLLYGSLALTVVLVVVFLMRPLNYSIDYTGGFVVEIQLSRTDGSPEELKELISADGTKVANIQRYGSVREMLIRLPPQPGLRTQELADRLAAPLSQFDEDHEILRIDFVGPSVGDEQKAQAIKAVLLTMLLILGYISFRFEKRFAVGSIIATAHDCIFILGFFSLFQLEFSISEFAAVLAVVGYSLNDTIVIYDRVRDNLRNRIDDRPVEAIIDLSINQTLARTLVTGGTTLLALLALLFFGGPILQNFSIALIVGVIVGTYSSIYIASASLLAMNIKPEDLILPEPE